MISGWFQNFVDALAVVDYGRRHFVFGDDARHSASDVRLAAVMGLAVFLGKTRVLIARVFAIVILRAG